jgi:hypothetical protein
MILSLFSKKFSSEIYIDEMKAMIDNAFVEISKEKDSFEIFTISIWTDPNAAASSISFDSKKNSDLKVQKSNAWNKKYYDQYIAEGDLEQAKLFEPISDRNSNPADFALRDYVEINNKSISRNWEERSKGKCWDLLEPLLKQIGEYALSKIDNLKIHSDFEIGVNGRQDWYEFTFMIKNK